MPETSREWGWTKGANATAEKQTSCLNTEAGGPDCVVCARPLAGVGDDPDFQGQST